MLFNLSNALHTIAAVIWVGGLFFSYMALRPAMAGVAPEHALPIWRQALPRFMRWVAISLIILWATGIYLMFFVYGGFGRAGWHVDTMFMLALIMTVLYGYLNHGIMPSFKLAVDARDFQTAGKAIEKVRSIVRTGLILGVLTVLVASWGAAG